MNAQRFFSPRAVASALAVMTIAAAGAAISPLAAQPGSDLTGDPSPGAPAAVEEMLAQRDRASQLAMSGRFHAAAIEWGRVARLQKEAGELPIEARWMQARMRLATGMTGEAAAAMEQLGEEALTGGSADVSARAFLEAAILYQRIQHEEAYRCMEQVERLMGALSAEQRASLEQRIVRG